MPAKRVLLLLSVVAFSNLAPSQTGKHLVAPQLFSLIAGEYSGELALENTRHIVQYHRIQGSAMMTEVADKVILARLRSIGLESKIEQFPSDGRTKYQTFTSPVGWEIRDAELWIESVGGDPAFKPSRLCRYRDVPMSVSTYSAGGAWIGEVVDVGSGLGESEYSGKDVRGKVALASGYAGSAMREAVIKRGALGIVIYPHPLDRPGHPDMVLYNGIWPRAEELDKTSGGFQISANQYWQLKTLMQQGPVRVRAVIDAKFVPGQLTLVHGYIRGSEKPEKEILLTAHLDHPKWSANDNASGSGALLEMARAIQSLIAAQKIRQPRATIHFMWVPEYYGTVAYVTGHPEACRCGEWDDPRAASRQVQGACILANLNLDMIGEDTVKTVSTFYMTRSPDSVPNSLDALFEDLLSQTKEANLFAPTGTHNYWPAEMSPYSQGSDHDIFVGLGIPSSMFGHAPDWTHHTSEDTMDKTDASEFLRVGVLATSATIWLAGATQADWDAFSNLSTARKLSDYADRTARILARGGSDLTPQTRRRLQYCQNVVTALGKDQSRNVAIALAKRDQAAKSMGSGEGVRISTFYGFPAGTPQPIWMPREPNSVGPRRLMLIPFDDSAMENLQGDDKKWWGEQASRFAAEPGLPLLVFEAVNFMDGRRSTDDIALALSVEFGLDIEQGWVDRLVQILASRKLAAPK